MQNTQTVNTAVYAVLNNDEALTGLCTVYKGAKRPGNASNPSLTIDSKRLERGGGEGIWMCDIMATVYGDNLANRTADHATLETVSARVTELLANTELELTGAKTFPLIVGERSGIEWDSAHSSESVQELTFGLIFVDFG